MESLVFELKEALILEQAEKAKHTEEKLNSLLNEARDAD